MLRYLCLKIQPVDACVCLFFHVAFDHFCHFDNPFDHFVKKYTVNNCFVFVYEDAAHHLGKPESVQRFFLSFESELLICTAS